MGAVGDRYRLAPHAVPAAADACEAAASACAEAARLGGLARCCEEAARAAEAWAGAQDDRATALLALSDEAPTTVMAPDGPGGTEALASGVMRVRNCVADEVMAEEERRAAAQETKRARRRRMRIAAAICLAVAGAAAVGVTAFVQTGGLAQFSQVTEADARQVLARDADVMDGFAENDYVEALPYELTALTVDGSSEQDGVRTLSVSAAIANGRFQSSFTAELAFVRASDLPAHPEFADAAVPEGAAGADWVGRVVRVSDVKTEAVAGIDFDDAVDDPDFSPSFDRGHQTCTYTVKSAETLWFAQVDSARTIGYAFNGTRWVRRSTSDAVATVRYRNLDGSYHAAGGDADAFDALRIEGLDAERGTFTLVYDKHAEGLMGDDAVSGSIACSIQRAEATPAYAAYEQADGCVYTFTGTGTSSAGDGAASVEGVLGDDYTIDLTLTADYTKKAFLFGTETPDTLTVEASFVK